MTMKKEINLLRLGALVLAGIVAVLCLLAFFSRGSRVDYDNLTEVKIKVMGTMVPSGEEYRLTVQNGVWTASYNRIEWGKSSTISKTVDSSFANDIVKVLKKHKAHKWDGFNLEFKIADKIGEAIMDGETYSFYMCFSDGHVTKAEGYGIVPNSFRAVFDAFEERFSE